MIEALTTESRDEIDFSRPVNLQLRIRNNILLQAIRRRSKSVAAFCRETGYPLTTAQSYIGFKESPVTHGQRRRGKKRSDDTWWRESAIRLATLLDLAPEDAFPPEISATVKHNTIEVFCAAVEPPAPQISPRDEVSRREIRSIVDNVLDTLNSREREILERRFGFYGNPESFEDIGARYGVGRERIRQIECKALRKLRHPSRTRHLVRAKEILDEVEGLA